MLNTFNTIKEIYQDELTEKKSRFIARIIPCESEEAALSEITLIKKKYYDARHTAYAYIIKNGEALESRFSDDKEPAGTAGKPILSILLGENLVNVLATVTRYFGGTLLGTGGLVKAYGGAVRLALNKGKIYKMELSSFLEITCSYTDFGKIKYMLEQEGLYISSIEYSENITCNIILPIKKETDLLKSVSSVSQNKATVRNASGG